MSPVPRLFARLLHIGLLVAAAALIVTGILWLLTADSIAAAEEIAGWSGGESGVEESRSLVADLADLAIALFPLVPIIGYLGLAFGFSIERRIPHLLLVLVQIVLLTVLGVPILWTLFAALL